MGNCGNHTQIAISRSDYEELPAPICTDGISDCAMQNIADDIGAELGHYNFDTASQTFEEDFEAAFWKEMEDIAVLKYGLVYYEDMK